MEGRSPRLDGGGCPRKCSRIGLLLASRICRCSAHCLCFTDAAGLMRVIGEKRTGIFLSRTSNLLGEGQEHLDSITAFLGQGNADCTSVPLTRSRSDGKRGVLVS